MSIKGFVFDLDGVITETAWIHFKAWQTMVLKLGIKMGPEMEKELRGIERNKCLDIILNNYDYEKKLSEKEKESLIEYKNEEYLKLISSLTEKDILPNMLNNLIYLRSEKIKIGLASVSKNAITIVKKLGIFDCFDYIVDIEKIKNSKPDPEIFITTGKGLNLNKDEIIVVDDSSIGMLATKQGGIKSIGIGVTGDYSFNNTSEFTIKKIKEILEELNGG